MFCGECGTQNPDTNQFCKNCGKPLAKRQQAPQPAAQPAPAPVTYPAARQPVPVPAVPYQPPVSSAATVPATAPGVALARRWNWLGIVSVLPGILAFGILPLILGLSAILIGTAGLIFYRKTTGRIGISSIIGIVLGIAAIAMTVLVV
jgi:hypothetical protein